MVAEIRIATSEELANWQSIASRKRGEKNRTSFKRRVIDEDVPQWARQIEAIISREPMPATLVLNREELGGYEPETVATELRKIYDEQFAATIAIATTRYSGGERVNKNVSYFDMITFTVGYVLEENPEE